MLNSGIVLGAGSIKLWDFVKRRCTATFSDHSQAVWDVSFHECGDFLVSVGLPNQLLPLLTLPYWLVQLSASHDHTAKLWDINRFAC